MLQQSCRSEEAAAKALRGWTAWCAQDPQYTRYQFLAKGSYGEVYVAKGKESLEAVAIKYSSVVSPRMGKWSSSRASAAHREIAGAKAMSTEHGGFCLTVLH